MLASPANHAPPAPGHRAATPAHQWEFWAQANMSALSSHGKLHRNPLAYSSYPMTQSPPERLTQDTPRSKRRVMIPRDIPSTWPPGAGIEPLVSPARGGKLRSLEDPLAGKRGELIIGESDGLLGREG